MLSLVLLDERVLGPQLGWRAGFLLGAVLAMAILHKAIFFTYALLHPVNAGGELKLLEQQFVERQHGGEEHNGAQHCNSGVEGARRRQIELRPGALRHFDRLAAACCGRPRADGHPG